MFAQIIHVEFVVLSGRFCTVRYILCCQVYPELDPEVKSGECQHFWGEDGFPKADWVHTEKLGGDRRVQRQVCREESAVLADVLELSEV